MEILSREEVEVGPVQLLASIDENGPQLYEGEIKEIVNRDQQTKNLVVQVTDPRLLQATGGIVQGMSGCPILQNGKLAGRHHPRLYRGPHNRIWYLCSGSLGRMQKMWCGEFSRTVKKTGFKPNFNLFRHDNFLDFSCKPLALSQSRILW